jgi:hypothetical protein
VTAALVICSLVLLFNLLVIAGAEEQTNAQTRKVVASAIGFAIVNVFAVSLIAAAVAMAKWGSS